MQEKYRLIHPCEVELSTEFFYFRTLLIIVIFFMRARKHYMEKYTQNEGFLVGLVWSVTTSDSINSFLMVLAGWSRALTTNPTNVSGTH